jgi:hypothetical protein
MVTFLSSGDLSEDKLVDQSIFSVLFSYRTVAVKFSNIVPHTPSSFYSANQKYETKKPSVDHCILVAVDSLVLCLWGRVMAAATTI